MNLIKNNLLISLTLLWFSSCAQLGNKKQEMTSTANQLINSLENCDTTSFLNLLDVESSHINESNYREFIKESFLNDCSPFKEIINKYGKPDLNEITLRKDSSQLPAANVAILPIISKEDTALNIKSCFLQMLFYPDEFFSSNSHLLRYSLVIIRLKEKKSNKIVMPDWLKNLDKK